MRICKSNWPDIAGKLKKLQTATLHTTKIFFGAKLDSFVLTLVIFNFNFYKDGWSVNALHIASMHKTESYFVKTICTTNILDNILTSARRWFGPTRTTNWFGRTVCWSRRYQTTHCRRTSSISGGLLAESQVNDTHRPNTLIWHPCFCYSDSKLLWCLTFFGPMHLI